jgi:hypothetical protein
MSRIIVIASLVVMLFVAFSGTALAQGPIPCTPPAYTGNQWVDAAAQAQYNVCYNSYVAQNAATNYATNQYQDWSNQWNQAGSNAQQWGQQFNRGTQWAENRRQDLRNSGYFGR